MYRFEKLVVNLSLTESDIPLLRFAGLVTKLACSDSIHFIYSREKVEVPASLQTQYPWLMEPINETALARARELIEAHFDGFETCSTSIEVLEKSPVIALLEFSLNSDTDLIITGGEKDDRGVAVKLARKAPCSLLVVPSESSGDFSKVCLGLDISRYSGYVVDVATAFSKAHEIPEIDCLHYFNLPMGYHKTNIPKEHLEKDLRSFSEERMANFLDKQTLRGVTVKPIAKESYCPGTALSIAAEHEGYDLAVIGCRGKDALTATLLGSNAEDTLKGVSKCAVLAVKEKGTGANFLESLIGTKTSGNLL